MMRKLGNWYRQRKTDKPIREGRIPMWWDFTIDCGWSDKWYRCGNCDICLHHRNRPNWDRLYNWNK
jgi:hypothetical protein